MSCLLCCCGSKTNQGTDAAAADDNRQDSVELEKIRGEADSASAVRNTEPLQDNDCLSIANSDDDEATDVPANRQVVVRSLTEYRCDIEHQVNCKSAMPNQDQQDEEFDDIGDLNNNNNNNSAEHSAYDAIISDIKNVLSAGILKEINLRRHEMNKSNFELSEKLCAIAKQILHYDIRNIELQKGRFYRTENNKFHGCLAFGINWDNVVLISDLPRIMVNQWCQKSEYKRVSSQSVTDSRTIMHLRQNDRAEYYDPVNSAISLMMNERYKEVGIYIMVGDDTYSNGNPKPGFIRGCVIFQEGQFGFYTDLLCRKARLANREQKPHSTVTTNDVFKEVAASLDAHAKAVQCYIMEDISLSDISKKLTNLADTVQSFNLIDSLENAEKAASAVSSALAAKIDKDHNNLLVQSRAFQLMSLGLQKAKLAASQLQLSRLHEVSKRLTDLSKSISDGLSELNNLMVHRKLVNEKEATRIAELKNSAIRRSGSKDTGNLVKPSPAKSISDVKHFLLEIPNKLTELADSVPNLDIEFVGVDGFRQTDFPEIGQTQPLLSMLKKMDEYLQANVAFEARQTEHPFIDFQPAEINQSLSELAGMAEGVRKAANDFRLQATTVFRRFQQPGSRMSKALLAEVDRRKIEAEILKKFVQAHVYNYCVSLVSKLEHLESEAKRGRLSMHQLLKQLLEMESVIKRLAASSEIS